MLGVGAWWSLAPGWLNVMMSSVTAGNALVGQTHLSNYR